MIRQGLKQALIVLAVAVGLALCLFLDTTPVRLSRLLGPIAAEVFATFRDPGTQWMVYACCAIYFVTFMLLGRVGRGAPRAPAGIRGLLTRSPGAHGVTRSTLNLLSPDLWLCGLALWVTVRYAFDYDTASRNTHALALMAGMAMGKGVGVWAGWRSALRMPKSECRSPKGVEHLNTNEGERRTSNVAQRVPPVGGPVAADVSPLHSILQADLEPTHVGCYRKQGASPNPAGLLLGSLILLLALAALWQPEAGTIFQYRGQARWQGPWDNPNTYGLLMVVGFVLAIGRLVQRWKSVAQASRLQHDQTRCRRDACATFGRILWTLILFSAAGVCGFGLIKSYSRGAWVGAALALGYLIWRMVGRVAPCAPRLSEDIPTGQDGAHGVTRPTLNKASWFSRNRVALLVLLLSLFTLVFWEFRHTEQPLLRRVFTVGNPNDFSWRNRVAAWEGALAMMAENPVAGVGWSRPEAMYDHYYRPVKVDEGMAIQLNHYFIVGMSAGVPALVFLLGYVGLCLLRISDCGLRNNVLPCIPPADQISMVRSQSSSSATACLAGAIVLLVGLWFDGGLFNLATATPLWILLAFVRVGHVAPTSGIESVGMRSTASQTSPAKRGTRWNASLPIFGWATCRFWVVTFLLSALLLTGLLWAHARDPFRRADFTVRASGVPAANAMAVMPKSGGPFPVVLWAHGSGGDLVRSGDQLRQIAELGVAAVGFDYDKTNQANFDAQMAALLSRLGRQRWAQEDSMGWIANSLGAQRTLSFAFTHPEQAPDLMVRLNGGWVGGKAEGNNGGKELGDGRLEMGQSAEPEHQTLNVQHSTSNGAAKDIKPSTLNLQPSTKLWLIHGENDEIFAADDVRRLVSVLEAQGVPVRLSIFPGRGHGFGPDQRLLVRAAAEWCANELGAGPPVPVSVRPALVGFWLPVGLLMAGVAVVGWRRRAVRSGRPNRWLAPASVIVGALAIAYTALHLGLPLLTATPRTVNWAERLVVRPELKPTFQSLAAYTDGRDAVKRIPTTAHRNAPPQIQTLLAHVELATLQRQLADWPVTDDLWREAVLSPWIEGAANDIRWRRMMWEHFYPRVRRESHPPAAAEIVARQLALRVAVQDDAPPDRSIREMWIEGATDPEGFERLYVAALRSVGVPARIAGDGRCEFHDGAAWRVAPRPFSESLMAKRAEEGTGP